MFRLYYYDLWLILKKKKVHIITYSSTQKITLNGCVLIKTYQTVNHFIYTKTCEVI